MSKILTQKDIDLLLNSNMPTKQNIISTKKMQRGGQPDELNSYFDENNKVKKDNNSYVDVNNYNNNNMIEIPELPREIEELANSATSEAKPEELVEMKRMEKVPEEVSGLFYHVVLDSDFGEFVDDAKRQKRPAVVFGKLARSTKDRVPVLYDRSEAQNVAKKLINMVVTKGSVGVENNKKYPYYGAVIVGFQFSRDHYDNITSEKVSVVDESGARNYAQTQKDLDLIFWELNGKTRGLLSKDSLRHTKIVDAQYIVRKDITIDNAFALLNLCPSLSVEDVQTLKCLANNEGKNCYGHGSLKEAEKVIEKIDVEFKDVVQLGGKYNNYKDLAVREKAKYLLNKKKLQKGGQVSLEGEQDDNNEEFWRQKYIQKKKEYLQLKNKQSGGQVSLEGEGEQEGDNNEEFWRQKYIQKKKEYLQIKNKQSGGKLMEHPTDDEDFWKPMYQQKKAEYISIKNKKK
jgi:hypothetical protein